MSAQPSAADGSAQNGRIVGVIPALDEARTIEAVVQSVQRYVDAVCVIDDGSVDGTGDLARASGAHVIVHPRNLGVGAAVAAGLFWAISQGANAVVQIDGDGQHDASYIPRLLDELAGGADLVVGSRFELGFEMGRMRRVAMNVFARLISRRLLVTVTDPTSGFRAFSRRGAEQLAPRFPVKYLSDTVEVLYIAGEHNLRVSTIPVKMHPRQGGAPSVGPLRSGVLALRLFSIIGRHSIIRVLRRR